MGDFYYTGAGEPKREPRGQAPERSMTRRTKIVLGIGAVVVVATGVIWAGIYRSSVDPKRLIGTWAFVSGGNSWGETTLTFGEDGKMQMTSQWVGKKYDSDGTYTVKGNTIEMLIVDDSDWGEASWGNSTKKGGGGNRDKSGTGAKSKPPSQPKQQSRSMRRRVTVRSLSETELVVVDERGRKTAYTRK
jgi:uncharacterized protein (TIGR03066 family)